MKKISLSSILISILITSCSYRVVDFTIISTKNVDLSKAGTFKRGKTRVDGKDMAHLVLWFPLGRPSMKEAIDRAIELTPGAIALVDGVVYSKGWWAIIYGQDILVVEGIPLIDPSLASLQNKSLYDYSMVQMDSKGNVLEIKELSEKEYNKIVQKPNSKSHN